MSAPALHSSASAVHASRATRYVAALAVIFLGASVLLAPPAYAAQAPVGLGTADSFAVLAGSGITNTGPTTITGDVGTFPTPSETGFGSITLTGTNHAGDAVTQGAKNDLVTAYNDAFGRLPVTNVPVELGGSTLLAGVYTSGTFGLTGTLTLDAKGDTNAEFIFQAGSTVIAEANSRVLLINGASPCHVVWQLGSSATFKTGSQFVGDVLAHTSITAQTAATFQGRLLALNGAVTLDTNTITKASCNPPSSGGGPTAVTPVTPTSPAIVVGPTTPTGTFTGPTSPIGSPSVGPTTPTGFPGVPTSGPGSPSTPGRPSTPFFTPVTPSSPSTPATPSKPSRPSLPVTGVQIISILATAVLLLTFGAVVVTAGQRRRDLQVS